MSHIRQPVGFGVIALNTACKRCGSTNRISALSILGRRHHCLDCRDIVVVKSPEQLLQERAKKEATQMREATEAYRERMKRQGQEADQKLREEAQRNSGTVIPEKRWVDLMADYEDLDYEDLEEHKGELERLLTEAHGDRDKYWQENAPSDGEYGTCQRLGTIDALLDDRYDPTPAYTKYPGPNGRPGSW